MTAATGRRRASEAFFGRRHGKTLRPGPAGALAAVLPRYRLDLEAPPPGDLRTLFELTKLDTLFTITDSPAAALASF